MCKSDWHILVSCGALAMSCVYSGFDKVGENAAVAGNTANGGANAGGGTAAIGGTSASGGAPSGGSDFGGTTSLLGGSTGAGGTPAAGGALPAGGTTATGGGSATTISCPGTGMVALPRNYCIDSTEVTQAQYQTWMSTNPSTSGQISVCSSWNTSFTPTCNWTATSTADYPVVCVDWCDAYAYCAGVGKRLCGQIGGGSNGFNDYTNATLSQWYAACTSNGTYSSVGYPYGNTYQASYCNGYDSGKGAAVAVGTMSQCQSTVAGYTGVYDLSGNVWEWEDSCDGTSGSSDNCRTRGGSFFSLASSSAYLECGFAFGGYGARNNANNYTGFRCCAP